MEKDLKTVKILLSAIAGMVLVMMLTVVISACILVPKTASAITELSRVTADAEAVIEKADPIIANLEKVVDDLAASDLTKLIESTQSLVDETADSMTIAADGIQTATEKIEKFDVDELNKAIKNLSTIIEPLANFFGTFTK